MITVDGKTQFEVLTKNSQDCISKEELLSKLQKSFETKKPLVIKAGFDPTYPDLHLGHFVLLKKLKQFQDFGHQVVFLIGDFTAQIGDPSGQDETRPPLSIEEIKKNTLTYTEQVFKVLDQKKTKVIQNSLWMENFSSIQWIHLCSQKTVARMLERDDFSKRFKNQNPIHIHEFLYPLVQGYDSAQIKADVEIGGQDQIFNLLVGRDLQVNYDVAPQCVLTFPLLEGLDGQKKMSKSFGNFIALKDSAKEIYGKLMSISDELMVRYYQLLVEDENISELQKGLKNQTKHPLEEKKRLAYTIVSELYDFHTAKKAEQEFSRIFSQKKLPQDIPEVVVHKTSAEPVWICHLLKKLNMISSTGEGKRLIKNGGIQVNSKKIVDVNLKITLKSKSEWLFQVGKRNFIKVKVK